MITGEDVVAYARTQLGVPWVHQGRLPGQALDCAGLIICAARELGLVPPDFDVNGYSRSPDGTMVPLLDQFCERINAPELGCIVCMQVARQPQHVGIAGDYPRGGLSLIHATNSAKPARVVEHKLVQLSNLRIVGAWRMPGMA